MRKPIQLILFMLVLALAGCGGKDKDATPSGQAAEGKLIATIDGQSWTSSTATATILNMSGYQITLAAVNSNGTSIGLGRGMVTTVIGESKLGVGVSATNIGTLNYTEKGTSSSMNIYVSGCDTGSGFVKITEQDTQNKTITGTFSGTVCAQSGTGQKKISGSFTKVKYQ